MQSLSSVDRAAPVMNDEGMADSNVRRGPDSTYVADVRVGWDVRELACA